MSVITSNETKTCITLVSIVRIRTKIETRQKAPIAHLPTASIGDSAGMGRSCLLNYLALAGTVLAHRGLQVAVAHQPLARYLYDKKLQVTRSVQLLRDPKNPAHVRTIASHWVYGGCFASAVAGAGGSQCHPYTHRIHAARPHPYSTRHSVLRAGVGAGTSLVE
jgi:hypothetical protein